MGDADGKAGGPSTGDTADGGGGGGTNADTRSHAEGDAFQGSGFQESGVGRDSKSERAPLGLAFVLVHCLVVYCRGHFHVPQTCTKFDVHSLNPGSSTVSHIVRTC